MTQKRKPVEHSAEWLCTEKESIANLTINHNKLSTIITGNGDPEKGLS